MTRRTKIVLIAACVLAVIVLGIAGWGVGAFLKSPEAHETARPSVVERAVAPAVEQPKTAPAALGGTLAVDYTYLADGSLWQHLYSIEHVDGATGEFSGTGHMVADPACTEIITGSLKGNVVTFHVLYTGTNANYTVDATGTRDERGNFAGTATGPGQAFTWAGTSGGR